MRVLFWYCEHFDWIPSMKTLDDAPDAHPAENEKTVVAFVHIEPADVQEGSNAETKLIKNSKWLARKWETMKIVLHSNAGYSVFQTPYGYFLDLVIKAPGHPLARIYKDF